MSEADGFARRRKKKRLRPCRGGKGMGKGARAKAKARRRLGPHPSTAACHCRPTPRSPLSWGRGRTADAVRLGHPTAASPCRCASGRQAAAVKESQGLGGAGEPCFSRSPQKVAGPRGGRRAWRKSPSSSTRRRILLHPSREVVALSAPVSISASPQKPSRVTPAKWLDLPLELEVLGGTAQR